MATANQIASLSERHHRIIELVLRGWTNVDIANSLSMNESSISIIKNSPTFQHELALRRARISEISDHTIVNQIDETTAAIRAKTLEAVERLGLVAIGKDEVTGAFLSKDADAVRACEAILDRGGYPRVQKTEERSLSIVVSSNDIARLTETLEMVGLVKPTPEGMLAASE